MSKSRSRGRTPRDAPEQKRSTQPALVTLNGWELLCAAHGYTALSSCAEVRMCVDVYADLIGNMTMYLMQNTARGDVRVRNGLSRKLDIEPHPLMSRKNFMSLIVHTLLGAGDGNAVILPRYTADGLIDRFEPCSPMYTSIVDDVQRGTYHVLYRGVRYEPDEIIHLRINPDPDRPWRGRGYSVQLREVVHAIDQANTTKRALMSSPAPSLIVKVDGLTEEFASREGRARLRQQYIDASENGQPWLIPAEAFSVESIKPLTLNDLAIRQNIELDKRSVAGIFGVPPFLVGVGSFNAEEFNNFVSTRVLSVAKVIEQEFTRQTLESPAMYWKLNPRSLYAYSMDTLINAGREMADRMALTRNEWRDWIGMQPREDMEELLALENYIPADKLGDQKKLNGGDEDGAEE